MANNKIAYGLVKEHGIDTDGMTPKQVWDALAKKGVDVNAEAQSEKAEEMGLRGEWEEADGLENFFDEPDEHKQGDTNSGNTNGETKKKRYVELPKKEYAELCSAIRTKYGNKIPKSDYLLYGNYYYKFKYDKDSRITCTDKMLIEGNEDKIKNLEREQNARNRK